MEINVQGSGVKYIKPDEVKMRITFQYKGQTYEEVLSEGVTHVQDFVNNLLLKEGFAKEDLKTRNFVIREEKRYDEVSRQYYPDGFSFNQDATLKFDYDREKIARMMVEISKLDNPPICQVDFGVKDEKECRKEVLALAYEDALSKASAIALAANKKLKDCVKVDFKPFTSSYVSETSLYSKDMAIRGSISEAIVNTFTPEDIAVFENLYCLWITE